MNKTTMEINTNFYGN